jgi:acyl-CoA synthetase (AMP-forming)/AMP-acid ligase II
MSAMNRIDATGAAPPVTLWDSVSAAAQELGGSAGAAAVLHAQTDHVDLRALEHASIFGGRLERLRGRSVLIATHEQLATAIALIELDGLARRVVLCTPDLSPEQLAQVADTAQAEFLVSDEAAAPRLPGIETWTLTHRPEPDAALERGLPFNPRTEWILLTSGTTGNPKLVLHSLESLAGTLPRRANGGVRMVWSTFYDIRRYGGLQIYLRAMLAGSSLVLSSADEPPAQFLARCAAAGVTHLSGTPSHWRRALMSGAAGAIAPQYVRLSGEIADQAVLDNLRAAYPGAAIGHAFASTEAGVAFDVNDGLAGFPADYVAAPRNGIDMKVEDGTLRIRSGRNAQRYLGDAPASLANADGYVDTGDLVELAQGRYYFRGRKSGVINVGGLKVHPEEVESVLNADSRVRISLVRARRNPITGAVVVADVVLAEAAAASADSESLTRVKEDLLQACRQALPPHKVPSLLRFVPALELTAAGKLVRPSA